MTRGALGLTLATLTVPVRMVAQTDQRVTSAAQTYKGLEFSVTALERASSAALSDCPPGANTQRAVARPGEGFVIVTVRVRVLPDYRPAPLQRAVLTDQAGKTYHTAAAFVDLGTVPEFSCPLPFRIPDGTRLKSIRIEGVTLDLTAMDGGYR